MRTEETHGTDPFEHHAGAYVLGALTERDAADFSAHLQVCPACSRSVAELEQIDEDTWHPHMYDFSNPDVSDQWGTANQMNEFVAQKSFNDPDKGLFVAPPV